MKLTKKQLFEAFVKEIAKQTLREAACVEKQDEDLDPSKVVHEALYEDEASMAEVEESENKRVEFDIPYEAYNILTQYWYGQGDPLYAVLSRSHGDVVNANDAELSRLISATEQALEDLEKSNEIYSEDEYMSLAVFLASANKAYTKLTGYGDDGAGLVGESVNSPGFVEPWYCRRCKEMVYDSAECPFCGAPASYPMEEAKKASKTEHSGAKHGKGAYYGKKGDAKKDSNKKRRSNDKKETRHRVWDATSGEPKLVVDKMVKEDYAPGMYDSVDDIVKKYVGQVKNNFSNDQNIHSIMQTAIVDAYNLGQDEGKKTTEDAFDWDER